MDRHVSALSLGDDISGLVKLSPAVPVIAPPVAAAPRPAAAKKRRPAPRRRYALPAWGVSLAVHVVVLTALAAATFTPELPMVVARINSALLPSQGGPDELVKIYADPTNQPRDQAVGSD